eukprot:TRINITY_DN11653_c1_g1_i1.p1 TRINITY_DN11653_c1_g1~~TRINITY_DN11653_c1_g1_i1.p1  ORF type:complete len:238 (-),score=27.42 TRINITY_DN11653_c1_g1_i1:44-757(-)
MQAPLFLPFFVLSKTITQVFMDHCERGDFNKIEHLCSRVEKEELHQGIRIACQNGHRDLLMEFLRLKITNPTQDKEECWMGWTLLHVACEKGQLSIARSLIKEGWSLSITNLKKQTPMDVSTPFVRMSLNLDYQFEKLLLLRLGAAIGHSIISSLPHELVTLIIEFILNDPNKNQSSQNNLDEELEDHCVIPPRIKERAIKKKEFSAKVPFISGNLYEYDDLVQLGMHWFTTPIDCK